MLLRSYAIILHCAKRNLSRSSCLCGIKSRKPWDKRFPVREEDVGPDAKGGSVEMAEALPEQIVAPTGIIHRVTKEFIHIPEMVPEFIVPDLTGFELKPYVSYKATEINQGPLTPVEIFNSVYAPKLEDDFKAGKVKVENDKITLADGKVIKIKHESAT
ncbi:39S ribosomal protein L41 mitochondrial [Biomphalaria glabrata]|uniref:39S ribosomal protein L41, mitochondrial-like n=3 Tax=Biomphalaria TaxID=6525 RepID=A0A9U8DYR1_BIOGL|nr:39S ribosomal protein L41, mitochondrial-like [Biomphalaria glabrata]KAI8734586.1 39S ribosomal protein L41; mitochondrial-like [Biomphalaria glabrata]KAI8775224.1 39S ribosomal protein L41, mitochondrial [Biomphalaria glabrata]KAK0054347.1 39S ribosomal protein L41 mitochondrial [Biomphalaria pfeifferi]